MRGLFAACIVGWLESLLPCGASAADPVYEIRTLIAPGVNPAPADVVNGSLDDNLYRSLDRSLADGASFG